MKKIFLMILSGLVMSSMLLGCGQEEKEEPPKIVVEEAVVEVEETPSEQVTELKVAYMANYGSLWSILNAMEQGYLEEENLKVNLIEFADGPSIVAAMESGGIDIGYIGQGAHKLCINGKAKVFALSHISNADMLIGGPGVESVQELNGKRVAYVEGTSSEDILVKSLAQASMTLDNVVLISMKKEEILDAMASGGVDAVAIWSPFSLEVLEKVEGTKKLADNMTFAEESVSLSSWIVSPKYAENNMSTILNFTRALFKAMDYAANQNQKETAVLVANQIGEDAEIIYEQRGDAQWLTGKEVAAGAKSGVVEAYYELQKQTFYNTGAVDVNPNVKDYVMLDVMYKAGQYE